MSDKTYTTDERGNAVKMPGWFSWRHETRDAHNDARERYLSEHGPAARKARAGAVDRGPVAWHPCGHRHGETSPGRCEAAS